VVTFPILPVTDGSRRVEAVVEGVVEPGPPLRCVLPVLQSGEAGMADETDRRQDLLRRVNARRAAVEAFLRERRPRIRRRVTATLVLTSLAALFTAGPASGTKFTEAVQGVFNLGDSSQVWQVLCLLATLASGTAAVMTAIDKANNSSQELSAVEAADAELEGLATLLEFGQLSLEDGVKLYQQYVTKIPFIDDAPVAARPG
jgi:hypothetical protein